MLLNLSMYIYIPEKKVKACQSTLDDTTFQEDSIDILCEDDVQLDSSLDETEEADDVSPGKFSESDRLSEGLVIL